MRIQLAGHMSPSSRPKLPSETDTAEKEVSAHEALAQSD